MTFVPINPNAQDPKTSFYYMLGITPTFHSIKSTYRLAFDGWRYETDSAKQHIYGQGYYGVCYINHKEHKLAFGHEGTMIKGISDLFDLTNNLQYMVGYIPSQLQIANEFISKVASTYPAYLQVHTGVSLGGILAQYQLFNNHEVLSIEAPAIKFDQPYNPENLAVANARSHMINSFKSFDKVGSNYLLTGDNLVSRQPIIKLLSFFTDNSVQLHDPETLGQAKIESAKICKYTNEGEECKIYDHSTPFIGSTENYKYEL